MMAGHAETPVISAWGIRWGLLPLPHAFSVSFSSKGGPSLKVHTASALKSAMSCRGTEHALTVALSRPSAQGKALP